MSKMTCKNCCLWTDDDPCSSGKLDKPICVVKPLFTHTDPTHECDEVMNGGGYYFSERKEQ